MWDGYNQVDNLIEGMPGGSAGRVHLVMLVVVVTIIMLVVVVVVTARFRRHRLASGRVI
jgi:hypothetical protein